MNMAQANTKSNKINISYNSMYINTAILMLNIVILTTTLYSFSLLKNCQDIRSNIGYSSSPVVSEHEQNDVYPMHASKEVQKYLKLLNKNIVSKRHIRMHKELETIRREKRRLAAYKRKEHTNYLLLLKRKQFLELEVTDLNRKKREILQEEAMKNYTQGVKENGSDVLSLSTGLVCNNKNRLYNCLLSNTSLESQGIINSVDISIKFKLLRNNSIDNGHLLFEMGLVSKSDEGDKYSCLYSVKFRRCNRELGVCVEIQDELSTDLQRNLTQSTNGFTALQYTLKIQHSFIVLLSKAQILHISNLKNGSGGGNLWPAVYIYNPHIIDATLSVASDNNIGFDTKYKTPSLYLSTNNKTVSNWERNDAHDSILLIVLEMIFVWVSICFILSITCTRNNNQEELLRDIFLLSSALIGSSICLYYIYMYLYWSLLLLLFVFLGSVLYECTRYYKDVKNVFIGTFLILAFLTFLISLSHMIYILYINLLSGIL